jgi:hypothetical protein
MIRTMDEAPTRALRSHSPALLTRGLDALLADGEEQWLADTRDLLIVLAPYFDCAVRLGLDPAAFFETAAASGPSSLQETVTNFGRRTDVTAEAFGFCVVEDGDGPRYEWT